MLKFGLVFLTLFMTVGVNMPDNTLARLGLHPDYLMAALVAFVISGIIVTQSVRMIAIIAVLSLAANLPVGWLNFGLPRDYLVAALIALVLSPILARYMN